MELVTKSFAAQCLAFPAKVDQALATIKTVTEAKELLDKATVMASYAERLKAGISIERPIALGVLKIKAHLGELLPATPPTERGRGKKNSAPSAPFFEKQTIAAYRKIAKNKDKIEEYYKAIDDVPTQGEFIRFATGAHVSNNSGENEWYTPSEYIEAARKVLGSIDLDPASTELANAVVKAKKYYTADDDALELSWAGNVWMNPPYSKDLIKGFCQKITNEEMVKSYCVLVNNATETEWFQLLASNCNAICFPASRVKFWSPDKDSKQPLQGQAILYRGGNVQRFCECFGSFGFVLFKEARK